MKELIIGGARSGKSSFAEQKAVESKLMLKYIATAQAKDDEMHERICHHQSRRGSEWRLIEEPLNLPSTLEAHAHENCCLLVDCLTLWLTNCLLSDEPSFWVEQKQKLLELLPNLPGHIIFVGNEVGMGVVPMGELSRRFVDESGWLHQDLAKICDKVTFVVAGLPYQLKGAV